MLTYDQCEYIRKQYIQFLRGRIPLQKINARLQKYFKTEKDFTEVLTECKKYNKGYCDIGLFIAE